MLSFPFYGFGADEKAFREFTPKVGWVDVQSELFRDGLRPGDEISGYDDIPYTSLKDHLYAPMTASEYITVSGSKIDYQNGAKVPFQYVVPVYPHPRAIDKDLRTAGILDSANYLIYQPRDAELKGFSEGSPLLASGIQPGDRLIWANGELLFSQQQLIHLMNDNRALVTIQRGNQTILRRVPRVLAQELRLDAAIREELTDWQFEAGLQQTKLLKLYTLPYNITVNNVIQKQIHFIDRDAEEDAFPKNLLSSVDEPLLTGDKIIAVDGIAVKKADEVLARLQTPHVLIIVSREPDAFVKAVTPEEANSSFVQDVNWDDLNGIVNSVGTKNQRTQKGQLFLLNPIVPKTLANFASTPADKAKFASEMADKRKFVDAIDDPDQRAHAQQQLSETENQLNINPPYFRDRRVVYNPSPFALFHELAGEIWRTLGALVSGTIGLKWVTGPIGLLQIVQENWAVSVKEGLFWVGAISLNLGLINLLPIPLLDGGTIALCLWKWSRADASNQKPWKGLLFPSP